MTPLTLYLAKLFGAGLLLSRLWMLTRRDAAAALMRRVMEDPAAVHLVGLLRLFLGLAMVLGHDLWSGLLPLAVTLLGWIIFLSGLLLLFAPHARVAETFAAMQFENNAAVYAFVAMALGLSLLVSGYVEAA